MLLSDSYPCTEGVVDRMCGSHGLGTHHGTLGISWLILIDLQYSPVLDVPEMIKHR